MSLNESSAETSPLGLQEGILLAGRARDAGDWGAFVGWLGRHPEHAEQAARFLSDQQKIDRAVKPLQPAARIGTVLSDYELLEVLGSGTTGDVYRAVNPRSRQEVAVKVIRTGGLSPAELVRVRFETQAMAGLNHPNVVQLLTSGETETVLYFAMPRMTGGSLASWLATLGPDRLLAPARAAEIVRDVALGVHHAHQSGLIHRDLKPANILLDRNHTPHVADFGLARRADATATTGAGTPLYMAPEQARSERHLTTAVDVHALGAILFELLAGRTPFGGTDVPSVLRRVADDVAPSVGEFRAEVPRDLQTICARCLKKAPQERYPSAQALAADLTKYLQGEPIDDDGRRGWVWGAVARALGWQRETHAMGSWRVGFWGATSTVFAMVVMQAAILLNAPLWVSQAAIAYYLIAWLGLVWGFLVVERDSLNPVERASTAIHFGAKFACIAILPVELWLHDGNPVYALPSFLAIIGLGVFAHGVTFSGRFYLIGLGLFLSAATMPLVPVTYWPAIYGLLLGAIQFWAGFHLRHIHKTAEAARRTGADPPIN